MIYIRGDVYNGQWEKDKMNGYGIYKYQNGTVYEGNWADGF